MPGPAVIFREIHRLRRHAKDLQAEIERIPRHIKGQQAKVTRQEEEAREAHERLKRLKITNHEKEVHLKQTQELLLRHMDQMNSASSKKEYDAFKVEIANDRKRCQELEDEIIAGMLQIDERTAQLPDLDKGVLTVKQESLDHEKSSIVREAQLREQLSEALKQIKDVETSLPEELRAQYERLVGLRGEDALALVQNRTCTACYTEITAQNYNDLSREQFVPCKSCGRMLYLAE